MIMIDVECESCDWRGNWKELITFPKSTIELCPECGEPDSIFELNAIRDFNDREQEPREKIE